MRAPIFCLLSFLWLVPVASAQNLLSNGDFANDVSGWTPLKPDSFAWDGTVDAGMDENSGSGHLQNQSLVAFSAMSAAQCIPVVGGDEYDFGAEIHFDSGLQTAAGWAHVITTFYGESSCGGQPLETTRTAIVPSTNTDAWILAEELDVEAPLSSVTAQFRLYLTKQDDTGMLVVDFDNAEFTPAPEPGAAAMVSVTLFALGWVRRPRRIAD